jgi:hypothetical protein
MKAVLVREFGEYILHKFAEAEVIFAMSDHEKASEKEVRWLDKKSCDKIFGLCSPEQMSEDYANNIKGITKDERDIARVSYFEGISIKLETNKDNRFSEAEMRDALTWASKFQDAYQTLNQAYIDDYLKKLKEKRTEDAILVEVEMQYLPVSTFCFQCGKGAKALNENTCDKKYACSNWFPKYDENGCLILKKALKQSE